MKDFTKVIILTKQPGRFGLEEGNEYTAVVSREIVLLLRCLLPLGASDQDFSQEIFGFKTKDRPIYDSSRGVFNDQEATDYCLQEVLDRVRQAPDYLEKIAHRCQLDGHNCLDYSVKVRDGHLTAAKDEHLKQLASNALNLINRMAAYLFPVVCLQHYLEKSLMEAIQKRVSDQKQAQGYFRDLAVPLKPNFGYFEQVAILKLSNLYYQEGRRISLALTGEITAYLKEFGAIGVKYGVGEIWTQTEVLKRIQFLAQENPRGKLKHISDLVKNQEKRVGDIFEAIGADFSLKHQVRVVRTLIFLRTYRTDIISRSFTNLFPFFDEIARRTGLRRQEIINCLPNELVTFNFPSKDFIEQRISGGNIARGIGGKLYIAFNQVAQKAMSQIRDRLYQEAEQSTLPVAESSKEIKGSVANPGTARGTVRLVLANSDLSKVKEGDIIVAPMTTPDYVPAMERASGFITDEGGILSHAAIISREMNKPCIIGTKTATQTLKDGQLVELDANAGTVRVL